MMELKLIVSSVAVVMNLKRWARTEYCDSILMTPYTTMSHWTFHCVTGTVA